MYFLVWFVKSGGGEEVSFEFKWFKWFKWVWLWLREWGEPESECMLVLKREMVEGDISQDR